MLPDILIRVKRPPLRRNKSQKMPYSNLLLFSFLPLIRQLSQGPLAPNQAPRSFFSQQIVFLLVVCLLGVCFWGGGWGLGVWFGAVGATVEQPSSVHDSLLSVVCCSSLRSAERTLRPLGHSLERFPTAFAGPDISRWLGLISPPFRPGQLRAPFLFPYSGG